MIIFDIFVGFMLWFSVRWICSGILMVWLWVISIDSVMMLWLCGDRCGCFYKLLNMVCVVYCLKVGVIVFKLGEDKGFCMVLVFCMWVYVVVSSVRFVVVMNCNGWCVWLLLCVVLYIGDGFGLVDVVFIVFCFVNWCG